MRNKGIAILFWAALLLIGFVAWGQQINISGPSQIGWCEEGLFEITLTNNTTQTFSSIVITDTKPNAGFVYVTGSSTVDGTPVVNEPTEAGLDLITWNLDLVLGYAYELSPGGMLTTSFRLATNCSALSGIDVAEASVTGISSSPSDSLSVEILPGAVRIYKVPSVVDKHVGDTVTWTITVENTGLGTIYNVVATDVLGSGLSYASSTSPVTLDGNTVTWNLDPILAGESVILLLSATVISCEGLDNKADAKFGCDDGSICFDTAVDGGTATASIHLMVDNPLLNFTPPNIQIPYCNAAETTVTMPVTNNGSGPATDVQIYVNFPAGLQVQNVQAPATWDVGNSYFHLPNMATGGTFNLVYDLLFTGDWCDDGPSGSLYYQSVYNNVCGDEFRPPEVMGSYGTDYAPDGIPTISVSLTGDDEVYICTDPSYNLAVSFSGLDDCGGSGTTSDISVQVDVPTGFKVNDTGGGTWTPGGDGTGGTITYTTTLDTPLNTSFTLLAPGSGQCGQVADLAATATATSCCGCALSSSSSIPIAIECYQLVTATRAASPTTQEKCGTITYTNTYFFANDSALDGISFDELTFTESANNQQDYVDASLSITIGGTTADPSLVTDTTPGGSFVIQGINDAGSIQGTTLVISYQLKFTAGSQPTSCPSSYSFYDWSTLDLGSDCATGNQCTQACQASEVLQITAATPSMSVSINGLPYDFVDPCGTYNVTVTLTKTSDFDPHDVRLQLENLNYYIVDLGSISCSGDVTPTDCTSPTDNVTYYEWDYENAFVGKSNGAESVLDFQVRKRCNPGVDLTATALFDDSCDYSSCSVSASDGPSIMREPLLYIYKTPEVIYATENEVIWTIYVTNGGSGPAYEVWVDDTLGIGLQYVSSTVDGDVTTTPNQDHEGSLLNGASWHIPVIDAADTRTIQFTAKLVGCDNLTNQVQAGLSCGGDECLNVVEDTASVVIPDSVVVATSYTDSPLPVCTDQYANITIRNAGDPTIYLLTASETLPAGLSYVLDSTEWQVDVGGWQTGSDPQTVVNPLTWTEAEVAGLSELSSRSTIEIRFLIYAGCSFTSGNLPVNVSYQTVCADTESAPVGSFYLNYQQPSLSVTKTQIPPSDPINCGGLVTWKIEVTNTGDAIADWVRIEDTLGGSLTYTGSSPTATKIGEDTQRWGWEFGPLNTGDSTSVEIRATVNQPTICDGPLRTNTASATWGCGAPGGDPTTSDGCESDIWTDDSDLLPMPNLAVSASDATLSCNLDGTSDFQVLVRNTGATSVSGVSIRVYIDESSAYETTQDIPAGGNYPLSFTSLPLKCGQEHSFRVVVNENGSVCECYKLDNVITPTFTCPCPALVTHKEVVKVLRGGNLTSSGTPIEPGDVIGFRFSVTNVGDANAYDLNIADTLPTEFLYVAGSTNASWPGGPSTSDPDGTPGPDLTWNLSATLAPGETLTLRFQAVVTSAVVQGKTYTDTMCATGTEGDGTPIPPDMSATVEADTDPDDCSSVSQVAAAVPALSVDKEIVGVLRNGASIWPTDQVEPGDLIHYRFTIRNVGNGTAYNVGFTDELPAGLESDTDYADGLYTVDSPAASGILGIPDGTMGTLSADISAEITGGRRLVADFYAYVTSAVQQGINLINYATAYGEDGYGTQIPEKNSQIGDIFDDDPDDVDPDDTGLALIGVGEPGLALSKEIVDALRNGVSIWPTNTVLPEDVLVYRVTVNNVGQATAYNVDFADQLPLGLEYDTTYGSGTYQVDSPTQSGTLPFLDEAFCPFNADISLQLAPGATLVIEYRVRVRPDAQPGSLLENHAEVTGDDGAGNHIPIYNPDVEDNYPDDDLTDIRVGIPALVTSKEIYIDPCGCDIPSMEPGTEFKFVLTVKNVGFSTAYGIVVDDLLPPGLIYVPKTSELHRGDEVVKIEPLVDPKGRALTWITGLSLDPGDTLRLIFSLRIEPGLAIGTKICNTMQASGVDYLGQPIPADASDYVPADVDPQDSSSLQFTIGEPPSMGPSSRREQGEGEA